MAFGICTAPAYLIISNCKSNLSIYGQNQITNSISNLYQVRSLWCEAKLQYWYNGKKNFGIRIDNHQLAPWLGFLILMVVVGVSIPPWLGLNTVFGQSLRSIVLFITVTVDWLLRWNASGWCGLSLWCWYHEVTENWMWRSQNSSQKSSSYIQGLVYCVISCQRATNIIVLLEFHLPFKYHVIKIVITFICLYKYSMW